MQDDTVEGTYTENEAEEAKNFKWRGLGEAVSSNVGHGGFTVCVRFKFETKE